MKGIEEREEKDVNTGAIKGQEREIKEKDKKKGYTKVAAAEKKRNESRGEEK